MRESRESAAKRMAWSKDQPFKVSQCLRCTRAHNTGPTCDAFPEAIPDVILLNEFDHHHPFPGDNGLQFKPIKEETP